MTPRPWIKHSKVEHDCFSSSVKVGKRVVIYHPSNVYGCSIGDDVFIGPFVEIQRDVIIRNRVKICSHAFLCSGVEIGNDVFIGHSVVTCNDRFPRASVDGRLKTPDDWEVEGIIIEDGASIGSGAVLLPGIRIGTKAMVGAGAVVIRDVASYNVVAGNPARVIRRLDHVSYL